MVTITSFWLSRVMAVGAAWASSAHQSESTSVRAIVRFIMVLPPWVLGSGGSGGLDQALGRKFPGPAGRVLLGNSNAQTHRLSGLGRRPIDPERAESREVLRETSIGGLGHDHVDNRRPCILPSADLLGSGPRYEIAERALGLLPVLHCERARDRRRGRLLLRRHHGRRGRQRALPVAVCLRRVRLGWVGLAGFRTRRRRRAGQGADCLCALLGRRRGRRRWSRLLLGRAPLLRNGLRLPRRRRHIEALALVLGGGRHGLPELSVPLHGWRLSGPRSRGRSGRGGWRGRRR